MNTKLDGEDYLGPDHLIIMKQRLMFGDMVEKIAKPVAKIIDAVTGTDLEHCNACKKRKEWLNSLTAGHVKTLDNANDGTRT